MSTLSPNAANFSGHSLAGSSRGYHSPRHSKPPRRQEWLFGRRHYRLGVAAAIILLLGVMYGVASWGINDGSLALYILECFLLVGLIKALIRLVRGK